ncbi:MAG: hypothetical protein U1F66_01330 [bacterium]
MDIQAKIANLKVFLSQSLKTLNSTLALKNLEMAKQLMKEIEGATLSNPWVNCDHIQAVVGISRDNSWKIAEDRIVTLRRSQTFNLAAS